LALLIPAAWQCDQLQECDVDWNSDNCLERVRSIVLRSKYNNCGHQMSMTFPFLWRLQPVLSIFWIRHYKGTFKSDALGRVCSRHKSTVRPWKEVPRFVAMVLHTSLSAYAYTRFISTSSKRLSLATLLCVYHY
jgi:hypothetical protein